MSIGNSGTNVIFTFYIAEHSGNVQEGITSTGLNFANQSLHKQNLKVQVQQPLQVSQAPNLLAVSPLISSGNSSQSVRIFLSK